MAAGVPVVATKVGGNSEVVEDGVTGILVPPGDSGALARAICEFLEKPELACRYGLAGKQRISERFDLGDMVRQTEQHYLRLLNEVVPEPREVGEVPA
jgi:glycosyltransferase involved in cell wall biosynthesis